MHDRQTAILNKQIKELEERIQALETHVRHLEALGPKVEQTAAALKEVRSEFSVVDAIHQELAKLRDGVERANFKATEVEGRLPKLREEIEKYYRDSSWGILVSVGVLIVIILIANMLR